MMVVRPYELYIYKDNNGDKKIEFANYRQDFNKK